MANGEDTRNHPNRLVGRDRATHGEEGKIRTEFHPLQEGRDSADAVGTYIGSVGQNHMFSAESTGGGATDSHMVSGTTSNGSFGGGVPHIGGRYIFKRGGNADQVFPYSPGTGAGIPGAPMSDTKAENHDRNYR